MGTKLDVLDVDAAGNTQIRYTYIWCMSKQTGPMGNLSYDSAQQATPPAGMEPLAAFLNQSYTVKLSPKGRVLDVSGVEQMKAAVHEEMPPGAEAGPMGNVAATFLEKTGVKEMTEGLMAVYPDKPVEPGQSWSEKRMLTAGFGRIEEIKWTLQKEEAGVATIGQAATIRSDPDGPADGGPGHENTDGLVRQRGSDDPDRGGDRLDPDGAGPPATQGGDEDGRCGSRAARHDHPDRS